MSFSHGNIGDVPAIQKKLKGIRKRVGDFVTENKTKPETAVNCKSVKLTSGNLLARSVR